MADVRKLLLRVNINKAAGQDSIPGRVLNTVSSCLKAASIIPVTENSAVSSLNEHHPVALTSSWLSASRNSFSSTSETTSLPAWTLTSMLSETTDPQRTGELYCEVCWHHHHRLRDKQLWEFLSRGNQLFCRVAHKKQVTAKHYLGTKELIVLFLKKKKKNGGNDTHPCLHHGAEVEQVNSFRFLGITITENLSWSRKHADWNHHKLVWINAASDQTSTEPKDTKRQLSPSHSLFTLLPSDNRYRSICCCNTGLQNNFIPQTVRLILLYFCILKNDNKCTM